MAKIISIHSFRGGTGKSNTTANIATLLAMQGLKVAVIDTDISSPGIHVLFGLDEGDMGCSLNDYLWGKCSIEQTTHDVTPGLGGDIPGKVLLVPSSMKAGDITRVLREGYNVNMLNDAFQALGKKLKLDAVMIDTHPGLGEETLLSIATSDTLIIIMRPDHQDYQGTAVTVEVARKLDVPRMMLLVNKVPAMFPMAEIKARVEKTYGCEVVAVLPHSDEMMTLASEGVFAVRYPEHPFTLTLKQVAKRVMA